MVATKLTTDALEIKEAMQVLLQSLERSFHDPRPGEVAALSETFKETIASIDPLNTAGSLKAIEQPSSMRGDFQTIPEVKKKWWSKQPGQPAQRLQILVPNPSQINVLMNLRGHDQIEAVAILHAIVRQAFAECKIDVPDARKPAIGVQFGGRGGTDDDYEKQARRLSFTVPQENAEAFIRHIKAYAAKLNEHSDLGQQFNDARGIEYDKISNYRVNSNAVFEAGDAQNPPRVVLHIQTAGTVEAAAIKLDPIEAILRQNLGNTRYPYVREPASLTVDMRASNAKAALDKVTAHVTVTPPKPRAVVSETDATAIIKPSDMAVQAALEKLVEALASVTVGDNEKPHYTAVGRVCADVATSFRTGSSALRVANGEVRLELRPLEMIRGASDVGPSQAAQLLERVFKDAYRECKIDVLPSETPRRSVSDKNNRDLRSITMTVPAGSSVAFAAYISQLAERIHARPQLEEQIHNTSGITINARMANIPTSIMLHKGDEDNGNNIRCVTVISKPDPELAAKLYDAMGTGQESRYPGRDIYVAMDTDNVEAVREVLTEHAKAALRRHDDPPSGGGGEGGVGNRPQMRMR